MLGDVKTLYCRFSNSPDLRTFADKFVAAMSINVDPIKVNKCTNTTAAFFLDFAARSGDQAKIVSVCRFPTINRAGEIVFSGRLLMVSAGGAEPFTKYEKLNIRNAAIESGLEDLSYARVLASNRPNCLNVVDVKLSRTISQTYIDMWACDVYKKNTK